MKRFLATHMKHSAKTSEEYYNDFAAYDKAVSASKLIRKLLSDVPISIEDLSAIGSDML
jgi:hypothetical protein